MVWDIGDFWRFWMIQIDPNAYLGPIWYHLEPSDITYYPNQFLGWDFFCHLLQQDGSSQLKMLIF